jgi:recombinational DNA repair ATPase RecF
MLQSLTIHDVGPLAHAEATLRPRMNVVTGDSGLGKSFLLELAWWVLTSTLGVVDRVAALTAKSRGARGRGAPRLILPSQQ